MRSAKSAAGRSWRLLAEHIRVIAAHTARLDRRVALIKAAEQYEVKAGQEDERASARRLTVTS